MLIRSVMTTTVLTIDASMSCAEVWHVFQEKKLRRAPVLDAGVVVGMITDRDIKKVLPWTIEEQERRRSEGTTTIVRTLLAPYLLSVGPNDHLEKAAHVMLRAKVGGLPVLDGTKLVGIITESDIFKLFVRRTMTQKGDHLILRAPAGTPRLLDPAKICVRNSAKLYELAMYPIDKTRTSVVMQVHTADIQKLVDAFLAEGYEFVLTEKN